MAPASSWASRPVGASTRIRSPSAFTGADAPLSEQGLPLADIIGNSGQHTLKRVQRLADAYPPVGDLELADGMLVMAAPLLQHRDSLAHLAKGLEEPQRQEAVGQIADLGLAPLGGSEHSVLRQRHQPRNAPLG